MGFYSTIKSKLAERKSAAHVQKALRMIECNYKVFKKLRKKALAESDENRRIKKIRKAATWAVTNHTGLFSCNQLEEALCKIAQAHSIPLKEAQKGAVLHILTTGYKTGGHTRVADKWIAFAPEGETHSLALIDQKMDDEPEFLYETTLENGGNVYHLDKKASYLEKALELRKLASGYEKVVLHVHMNDPVPILAFGTEEFKSPIIFYNHADHVFWLGVSVADVVVDLTSEGALFSHTRRGVKNTTILPVPISSEQFSKEQDKPTAHRVLGLPADKKIMLSIGGSWRFVPSGEFNFPQYCTELLQQNNSLMVVIVGVDATDPHWKKTAKKFTSERLFLAGRVTDRTRYQNYITAADFYIESLPAGAEITTLEVGLHGVPVYILNQGANRAEVFNTIYAQSYTELKTMVNNYLKDGNPPKAQKAFQKQVAKVHSEKAFKANIARTHKNAPETHKVTTGFEAPYVITSYDTYLYRVTKGMHKTQGLWRGIRRLEKWGRKLWKHYCRKA